MIQISRSLSLVIISMLLAACSHFQNREAAYLDSAKGWATQAQVREKLGAPKTARQDEGGATVWVYELREQQSGNRLTARPCFRNGDRCPISMAANSCRRNAFRGLSRRNPREPTLLPPSEFPLAMCTEWSPPCSVQECAWLPGV